MEMAKEQILADGGLQYREGVNAVYFKYKYYMLRWTALALALGAEELATGATTFKFVNPSSRQISAFT